MKGKAPSTEYTETLVSLQAECTDPYSCVCREEESVTKIIHVVKTILSHTCAFVYLSLLMQLLCIRSIIFHLYEVILN